MRNPVGQVVTEVVDRGDHLPERVYRVTRELGACVARGPVEEEPVTFTSRSDPRPRRTRESPCWSAANLGVELPWPVPTWC
jgi:hypothetical protein